MGPVRRILEALGEPQIGVSVAFPGGEMSIYKSRSDGGARL